MLVRYGCPISSMCLRCLCCGECYFGCLQFVHFPIIVSVLCLSVLVNCLLNVIAICVGEVRVFSLKVMLLLGCAGGFCWLNCVWSSKRVCVLCLYLSIPSNVRIVCLYE